MSHAAGRQGAHDTAGKRTLAQWFCLLGGIAFLLAGIAGFFVDGSFDTGGNIDGDRLLGLEVNGIHNLVHIASGLLLLAAANTAPTARLVAIGFGASYLLVTLIGLIDGKTVLGLFPVNPADNIFHLVTSLLALAAGFMSPTFKGHKGRTIATDDRSSSGRFDRDQVADGDGTLATGAAHQGQTNLGTGPSRRNG